MYSAKDYELVKPIFNKIRTYPAEEIIHTCVNKIWYTEEDFPRRCEYYQPWRLLLLIKWTFIYGNLTPYPAKRFGETELQRLLTEIENLEGDLDKELQRPLSNMGVFLILRRLSFQQRPFQEPIHYSRLARQSILFGSLCPGDPLRESFFRAVDIKIEDFIELQFAILIRFYLQRHQDVNETWFASLAKEYPPGTMTKLLDMLSSDFFFARKHFTDSRRVHSPDLRYELSEMSPLRRFPLFQNRGKYSCHSPMLLYRALESQIYDVLRNNDPQAFGNYFGKKIFEEYVGHGINHSRLPFVTEADLARELRGQGKLIDYIIVEGDVHIFIDAKAVEMTYIGEVSEEPDLIIQRVQSSVIKGIHQAYESAQKLNGLESLGGVHLGEPVERYLLIVTYRDLYLGTGKDFYEYLAKNILDDMLNEFDNVHWIPFENMYFVSIEDFELLVQSVHERRISFASCFRYVVRARGSLDKRKLVLRQYLHDLLGQLRAPDYLDEEFKQITDRLRSKLPD